LLTFPWTTPAQTVVRHGDPTAALADRWKWAKAEAGREDFDKGYWIGYSIEKTMGEHTYIGSFYGDDRKNRPSLGELVTGMRVEDLPNFHGDDIGEMSGTLDFGDEERAQKMVKKEVGFLFRISATGNKDILDLEVSNLSLRVDLEGAPLIWIGPAGYEESVAFLEAAFKETESHEARKEFMMAIG